LGDKLRRKDGDRRATSKLGEIDRAEHASVIARAASHQVKLAGVRHALDNGIQVGGFLQQAQ
jgi:hypothetical protein